MHLLFRSKAAPERGSSLFHPNAALRFIHHPRRCGEGKRSVKMDGLRLVGLVSKRAPPHGSPTKDGFRFVSSCRPKHRKPRLLNRSSQLSLPGAMGTMSGPVPEISPGFIADETHFAESGNPPESHGNGQSGVPFSCWEVGLRSASLLAQRSGPETPRPGDSSSLPRLGCTLA